MRLQRMESRMCWGLVWQIRSLEASLDGEVPYLERIPIILESWGCLVVLAVKVVGTYLPRHSGNNDVGDAKNCRWL
jgi:hypothetical protein